jgi:hypothetical protein
MTTPLIIKEIDALLNKEGKPDTTIPNTPAGNRLKNEIGAGHTDHDYVAGAKLNKALVDKIKPAMMATTSKSIKNDALLRKLAGEAGNSRSNYIKALNKGIKK